jgi:predicted RNase H-like HicB family nuclease
MKASARYAKIVEWSDEDQCFVGSCPGLLYGGCHGDDEQAVFAELCELVEQTFNFTSLRVSNCRQSHQATIGRTRSRTA